MIPYEIQYFLDRGLVTLPENFMYYSFADKTEWLKQSVLELKKYGVSFYGITISKDQLKHVDDDFLRFVRKYVKNKYLAVDVSRGGLFSREEFENVGKVRNSVIKMGADLIFSEFSAYYEFEKVVEANNKLNTWAEQINSLRVDGKELSQLEKFYIAYSYVTKFVYQEVRQNLADSRSLISVLSGNKIVCVGYAQILKELCGKLGIECDTQSIAVNSSMANHMNCAVKINDPKYGVNGMFYSDPCFDANTYGDVSIAHALISYKDLPKIFVSTFVEVKKLEEEYKNLDLDSTNSKEEAKQLKADLSKFLSSLQNQMFEYVDKCVEGKKGHLITMIPTKKDLQRIIDLYIGYEVLNNEYGGYTSIKRTSAHEDSRIFNRQLFAEELLKYVRVKDVDKIKPKLAEVMSEYLPHITSPHFKLLVDAYSRHHKHEQDLEDEKIKNATVDLTIEQFKALMENLSKIEFAEGKNIYQNKDEIINTSLDRIKNVWFTCGNGSNPFCHLARIINREHRRFPADELIEKAIDYKHKYIDKTEAVMEK